MDTVNEHGSGLDTLWTVPARRLARSVVAACLVGVVGAACSDGAADPQRLPPLTPTGTASASPTPTATTEDLQQSAEQFIREYYREFDRANHSSDPSHLQDFYDPGCRPCSYNLNVLRGDDRKHRHLEDYEYELLKLNVGEMQGNTVAVTLELHNKPGRVVRDRDGSIVQQLPETEPVRTDVIIARTDSSWKIVDIVPLGEVKS